MPFAIQDSQELLKKGAMVGRQAHLLDIRLLEIHGKVLDPAATSELEAIQGYETRLGIGRTGDRLMYEFEHDITLKGSDGKDAVQIHLRLGALFEIPAAEDSNGQFDEESLTAFGRTTVQMALHPYLRTAISDLTARLGCPPATLDLLLLA